MLDVTTSTDEYGNPVVIVHSALAEGRIDLLPDGTMALGGDFGSPMPTTMFDLLLMVLEKTRVTEHPVLPGLRRSRRI